ncbi:hypothetical protein HDU88_002806 [Geranomyces variabilis]|nr:hypothetical protein HDU88_002806 [Geranomyces variabilis]
MFLDDASSASLKRLLMAQLSPITDADPVVLADYVIALLKHDKPVPDLKILCSSQLDDFLKDETQPFVTTLFESLESHGYLGPSPATAAKKQLPTPAADPAPRSQISAADAAAATPFGKRGYEEDISEDEEEGDRNFKHTRSRGPDTSSGRPSPTADDRHIDRSRPDDGGARKRGQADETSSHAGGISESANLAAGHPISKVPRHELPPGPIAENKRRRSEEYPADDEAHRAKFSRGYTGPNPIGYPAHPARRDFERHPRPGQPRFPPHMMPNPAMGMGPGRWEGGPEWGPPHMVPGMQGPDRDPRYMDRGRMPDRQGGRGMPPMRGAFMNGRVARRPCRDYEERGYCLRGDACPYDHGVDRIVVDDLPMVGGRPPFEMMGPPGPMGPMGGVRPPPFNAPPYGANGSVRPGFDMEAYNGDGPVRAVAGGAAEGYDPERSSYSAAAPASVEPANGNGQPSGPDQIATGAFAPGDARNGMRGVRGGRGAPRGNFGGFNGHQGGYGGPQSGYGGHQQQQGGFGRQQGGYGQQQRTNDTLVVQNVPAEHLAIDKISDFFKKFGTITNIKINVPTSRAIVQFAQPQQAMAAYRSPDPIFDNRFVKVFWATQDQPGGADAGNMADDRPAQGGFPPHRRSVVSAHDPSAAAGPAAYAGGGGPVAAKPPVDEKREKAKQMLEMQQALIAKQLEEQKKIMEKLQSGTVNPTEKKALLAQFNILDKSLKNVMKSASTQVSAVQAQAKTASMTREERERERLDRELDALSKAPHHDAGASSSGTSGPDSNLVAHLEALKAQAAERGIDPAAVLAAGGEPRSAGQHFARGRGRGAWGASRGGRMTLDNRTTKIQVKNISSEAQLQLKGYFEKFGPVAALTFSDNDTNAIVEFASRRDAERALAEPVALEGMTGAEMTWHNAASSANASLSSSPKAGVTSSAAADAPITATTAPSEPIKPWDEVEEDDDDEDAETSWKRR